MKYLSIFIAVFIAAATALGEPPPLTLSNPSSSDGKYKLAITHSKDKDANEFTPLEISLIDARTKKIIHSIPLEIDNSDSRRGVEVLWSPGSRYVIVNQHLAQLWWFTVYDVSDKKLRDISSCPVPKKFQEQYFIPKSTKSRGGQWVTRWIDRTSFIAEDTVYYVDITFHITDKNEIQMVKVKENPE